jgi:hypothetical protein
MSNAPIHPVIPDKQPGVRSVKKQTLNPQTADKTRNVSLTVIAVALVLLVSFLAASGTKVLDITALQGKGEGQRSEQQTPPTAR